MFPGDIDLFGLKLHSYLINQSVPFEYKHGSVFLEKVSESIRFIMRKCDFSELFNYVDDLIYCGMPLNIPYTFGMLSDLLHQLGLDINLKTLLAPTTSMVSFSILVNTETRPTSDPPEKLQTIV